MTVAPCISIVNKDEAWNTYWNTVSAKYSKSITPEAFDRMEREIQIGWEGPISLNFYMAQMRKAISNSHTKLIQHIYQKQKALLDSGDENGITFLYQAAQGQYVESAQALIELGAHPNISITTEFTYGHVAGATPLWKSVTVHIEEESQHSGYFLSSSFDFGRSEAMIQLFLKYGAVAAPQLNEKGQRLLQNMRSILDQKKTTLISTLKSEFPHLPQVLRSIVVDYV